MQKNISCPLCFEHDIKQADYKNIIYFPHKQPFDMKGVLVESCPLTQKELAEKEKIVEVRIAKWLCVSILKLDDNNFRFILEIKYLKRNELWASYTHSADDAIDLITQLKISLFSILAKNVEKNKTLQIKNDETRSDLAKKMNQKINQTIKPFFTAIRAQRGLNNPGT